MSNKTEKRLARRVQADHDVFYTMALQCVRDVKDSIEMSAEVEAYRGIGYDLPTAVSIVVGNNWEFEGGER